VRVNPRAQEKTSTSIWEIRAYYNYMPIMRPGVILVVKYYKGEPAGRHLEIHPVDDIIETMYDKYKLNP